jgi:hypothetical protein
MQGLLAAAAAAVAVGGWAVPAGAQAEPAHIRLAHFSPDTPEMDVYVAGFDGEETRVLEGLGYGEVSDYAELPAGSYTFLLRPMGAPADSDPAVTASAELEEGAGYTFAAMGPNAELQKALLTDDLSPPPAGKAKVRLIQASSAAGEVDVAAVDGPVLAVDRPFASATDYAPVDAGSWTVQVTTADGTNLQRRLQLDAGTVNTLVVLENASGVVYLTGVADATGVDTSGGLGARPATPLGGVNTGGGGLADGVIGETGRGDGLGPMAVLVVAAIAVASAAMLLVVTASRRSV